MPLVAAALVSVAAILHACWNLLTKRSVDKLTFIWWTGVAGTLWYLPLVLALSPLPAWPAVMSARVALAALLRAAYFLALGAAYARADLSLVYPLARGTAPVLVPVLAVFLLGETLTVAAKLGIAAVTLGAYTIHLPAPRLRDAVAPFRGLISPHAGYALLTGVLTATYSVVDKWNIASGAPPLLYAYLTIPVAALLLTPLILRRRSAAGHEWRLNRWAIQVVALLMTGSYLLVLHALQLAPVSYVAPARELSIVFGTLLGGLVLREPHLPQRVAGAVLIVLGVALLTSPSWSAAPSAPPASND